MDLEAEFLVPIFVTFVSVSIEGIERGEKKEENGRKRPTI